MPKAENLEDLLRIRDANRDLIAGITANMGSALGFKRKHGEEVSNEPAILVFVPHKIDNKWLDDDEKIPKTLQGPDGLECPTDVIEASSYEEQYVKLYNGSGRRLESITGWSDLQGRPPLSEDNIELLQELRGWSDTLTPGSQLSWVDENGEYEYFGTLGCFVRDRVTDEIGILTNDHVADYVGNVLRYPGASGRKVGTATEYYYIDVDDEERFPGLVDENDAKYTIDAAYLELDPDIAGDIDPEIPRVGRIGPPLPLDLKTMGPVGKWVTSVGAKRGQQRGKIVAFGYAHESDEHATVYTDYLIIGEDDYDENGRLRTRTAFSDVGDSGKVIVTDDADHNIVALLWGGWQQRLRAGRMQEDWTYAADINYVFELLEVELYRG